MFSLRGIWQESENPLIIYILFQITSTLPCFMPMENPRKTREFVKYNGVYSIQSVEAVFEKVENKKQTGRHTELPFTAYTRSLYCTVQYKKNNGRGNICSQEI